MRLTRLRWPVYRGWLWAGRGGIGVLFSLVTVGAARAQQEPWKPEAVRGQVTTGAIPSWPTAAAPLVFQGVTVIDVRTGRRLRNRTVVIVGNRIRQLGPAGKIAVSRTARVVNAHGKYLIPGLWDMHMHEYPVGVIAYPLLIANGVTGIRDPGSSTPLDTLTQWKREIMAGTRVGPRMVVSGPAISESESYFGPVLHGDTATTTVQNHVWLVVPRALLPRVIDSLKAAGADVLKMYWFGREGFFVFAAAARRAGIPFGGHLPNGVSANEAADSGATYLDHLVDPCWPAPTSPNQDTLVGAACAAAVRHFRQQGSWLVMAPVGYVRSLVGQGQQDIFQTPAYRLARYFQPVGSLHNTGALPDSLLLRSARTWWREPTATEDWVRNPSVDSIVSRLHADGVPMLVGSDRTPPGFILQQFLVALAQGGLTPLEVLQVATLNPARALHATDSLGTVAVGKVADLVLLDADPLDDIWHTSMIRAVVANGRYFDRAALDRILTDVHNASVAWSAKSRTP